ncbi:MAG: AmmeMemoRadiSam system protein A [Anaeromyxobacter sp.]
MPLSPTDRAALLGLAREAIRAHLAGAPAPALPGDGPLAAPSGAFVTLRQASEVRGAMGTFTPEGSLAATVTAQAVRAAADDPRFPPLAAEELPGLRIEVAVVGPPRALADRRAVRVEVEGLRVTSGWHRGLLLPAAARAGGWDAAAYLKHVCLQAGLHARAWQEPATVIEAFEAEEFGEEPTTC